MREEDAFEYRSYYYKDQSEFNCISSYIMKRDFYASSEYRPTYDSKDSFAYLKMISKDERKSNSLRFSSLSFLNNLKSVFHSFTFCSKDFGKTKVYFNPRKNRR